MEGYWKHSNQMHLIEQMDYLNSDDCNIKNFMEVYFHEFAHTVELNFDLEYGVHYVQQISPFEDRFDATMLLLLNKFVIDGSNVGIPPEYWTHDCEVRINYVVEPIDMEDHGKIVVPGETDDRPSWITYVALSVHYGSDFSVEAIPDDGYRFVKWSDGVTTAIRYDTNIISMINVKAIFEKI